jgi:hypothetical protein
MDFEPWERRMKKYWEKIGSGIFLIILGTLLLSTPVCIDYGFPKTLAWAAGDSENLTEKEQSASLKSLPKLKAGVVSKDIRSWLSKLPEAPHMKGQGTQETPAAKLSESPKIPETPKIAEPPLVGDQRPRRIPTKAFGLVDVRTKPKALFISPRAPGALPET